MFYSFDYQMMKMKGLFPSTYYFFDMNYFKGCDQAAFSYLLENGVSWIIIGSMIFKPKFEKWWRKKFEKFRECSILTSAVSNSQLKLLKMPWLSSTKVQNKLLDKLYHIFRQNLDWPIHGRMQNETKQIENPLEWSDLPTKDYLPSFQPFSGNKKI